uniref:CD209 antigen-like protein E n=1 Tax=Poecilia latipinna TaxID=48699 RepID=A0A3B3V380_9TELE
MNVDPVKTVCQIPVTKNEGKNNTRKRSMHIFCCYYVAEMNVIEMDFLCEGSGRSKKRLYVGVIISLGILNVFLLIGLISLGVFCEFCCHMFNCHQLKTCPAGWRMFSCSCYLLSASSGSWDEGRADCRTRGGDLVVINNDDEQTFLSTFTNKQTWIGLNDKETEGSWMWVDGTPLLTKYWATPQPDNGGGDPRWGEEDCVHIRTYDNVLWNDLKCSASFQWVCEKDPI